MPAWLDTAWEMMLSYSKRTILPLDELSAAAVVLSHSADWTLTKRAVWQALKEVLEGARVPSSETASSIVTYLKELHVMCAALQGSVAPWSC